MHALLVVAVIVLDNYYVYNCMHAAVQHDLYKIIYNNITSQQTRACIQDTNYYSVYIEKEYN